jgi:hypothetical protein
MVENAPPTVVVVGTGSGGGRSFRVGLATVALVALGPSGCAPAERYAKRIEVGLMTPRYESSVALVNQAGSFLTAAEKSVAVGHLDRVRSAYLRMIEAKKVEVKNGNKDWSFPTVVRGHLLVVAQARALRDDFLPASGLSDEEKKLGAKTCDAVICSANQVPSSLSASLQPGLIRLRDGGAAGDDNEQVGPDEDVRHALVLLKDALRHANVKKEPDGPCAVDFAADMKAAVDLFLEGRPILKATLAEP